MSFHPPSTSTHSSSRPTVAAALDAGLTGGLGTAPEAAARHQFFATDLDLRRAMFAPPPVPLTGRDGELPVRVRSAWIPGAVTGTLAERRTKRLWSFLEYAVLQLGLRTVVVPRSIEISHGAFLGAELRKRMTDVAGTGVRIAIGVRASVIYRGHDQLAQLQTLRHTAEEWDLDIALDLSGQVPHYLEAEAAVMRLFPRLTLVRMPSWVLANGELNTHDPISRRVVAALADQRYSQTISVIPSQPIAHLPFTRRRPGMAEEWTRTMIQDQYDRRLGLSSESTTPHSELFREHH